MNYIFDRLEEEKKITHYDVNIFYNIYIGIAYNMELNTLVFYAVLRGCFGEDAEKCIEEI